ncbi:TPA: hypothetical protein DDW35_11805 [Candidatus Sumerlaeota bacterium]|jgi:pyruvate dehydrogenase E2 component (dihydrolipoamide acetyltransferase)|nr:hypothetical protein [Candidatus Sumerlaeota bacterium]
MNTETPDAQVVRIPELSSGMQHVTLFRWLVKPGDIVDMGTPLFELETDKAAFVVESEVAGTVQSLALTEGALVRTGSVACTLGNALPAAATACNSPAETLGIPRLPIPEDATLAPLSPMRSAIARNLWYSKQTAPHFYMKTEINAEPLLDAYQRQKRICKASLNDLLVRACARLLMKYPAFRSQMVDGKALTLASANISIAVAVEDGLRVPVAMEVEKKTLSELAAETKVIIQKARAGQTQNAGKSTFGISNLTATDIEEFIAIINPPESAILAIGKPHEEARVVNGEIKPMLRMTFWLSSDHRLIDGVLATKFLTELRKILEAPECLEID